MHASPPDERLGATTTPAGAAMATGTGQTTEPATEPATEPRPDRAPDLPSDPAPDPAERPPISEHPTSRGGRHAAPTTGGSGWRRFVGFISKPVFVFLAVGIIAAVPRFYHLSEPQGRVFDEIYYTKDGCLYAGYPYKQCDLDQPDEQSWVHPPLGKWMIAAGIKLFGNDDFGWRFSAAFIGTLTCVLVSMLAFLLWRSSLWAFIAGLLAATESLLVVQSRTALLDIFEAFWVLAAFTLLVLDKNWIERRTPVVDSESMLDGGRDGRRMRSAASPPRPDLLRPGGGVMLRRGAPSPWLAGPVPTTWFVPPQEPSGVWMYGAPGVRADVRPPPRRRVPSPLWRPWRVAAGFAFGFAIGVKWSALAAVAGAMVLSIFWERTRRARAGVRGPFWRAVFRETFPVLLSLLLLPIVVYVFTYSGRFDKTGYPPYRYRPGLGYSWLLEHPSRLADETWQMQNFHHNLHELSYDSKDKKYTPTHPYESRPWSWLFLGRPVAYFYKTDHASKPNEARREVLGIGNPVIFWGSLITIPWLAVMWRRRRDWRAGLILVAIVSQYAFWFLPYISLQKVQFFFYATPIAPFLVLGGTYLVRDLARMRLAGSTSRPFLPVAVAYVFVAVALFVWFWPVLSGQSLSPSAWQARMWFNSWI